MSYLDIDNLDHDPDLAVALGNMVVAWARAETALVKAYAVTTKMHYNIAAAAYYNIPTFESRTKALLAMVVDRPDPFPERTALRDATVALADLAKARNRWVHGLWVVLKKKPSVTQVFNMKQPSATRRAAQVTTNAVRQHVMAVRQRTADLEALSPTKIAKRT
jgi:hypothetical protein